MSFYVDNFINNTSHFQINDARQTPIIIPTERQLEEFSQIFTTAQNIKREQFVWKMSQNQADIKLVTIQKNLDGLLSKLYKCLFKFSLHFEFRVMG